jgi:hypothetical protein
MPVTKGIVVFTDTPLARKARESVLEFLLLNHPLDCPICDQGGECDLQDEALQYGSDRGRYFEFKRSVENKECGPIVKTIRTRCIHCTRCVRFSSEVAGNEVIGMFGRGEESAIGTYVNSFINTELSGNLVDLCPVGALTSKPYAYKARGWELETVETVDFFDSIVSNIVVYKATSEDILRILPRNDSFYMENWISDRTRYAFDGLKYTPVDSNYKNGYYPIKIDIVLGAHINLERVYIATNYVKSKGIGSVNHGFIPSNLCLDVPFFYTLNKTFTDFGTNNFSTILQIGTNIRYEASLLNTIFRREQSRRGIKYATLGSFNSLRYSHEHQGNSFRTLYSLYENRTSFAKNQFRSKKELGLLIGVNACRHNYSHFFQQMVINVGKRFFIKTAQKDRLGIIHSSVGSIAFSHIGFSSKKREAPVHLTFAQPSYSKHCTIINGLTVDIENNMHFQGKSLYETSGLIIGCHGQRRKHVKVVNEIKKNKANFEVSIASFWWSEKADLNTITLNRFWDSISFFTDEAAAQTYFETIPVPFFFNPFKMRYHAQTSAPLVLLAQPVRDFFLDDSIAQTSITMADCSLYRSNNTNFINEN